MRSWNHNTHYHQLLLRHLPPGGAVLDVGCGDGAFAALLAERYGHVMALDPDAGQVAAATSRCADLPNVLVRQADFLAADLPPEHFDAVTALAAFHHMPLQQAAAEAVRVLKPGGRLVVLGVWTDRSTGSDFAWNVASVALNKTLQRWRGPDAMDSPATFDQTSWREIKAKAGAYLPNARLRRHLLWRYTLIWDKPARAAS